MGGVGCVEAAGFSGCDDLSGSVGKEAGATQKQMGQTAMLRREGLGWAHGGTAGAGPTAATAETCLPVMMHQSGCTYCCNAAPTPSHHSATATATRA